MKKNEFYGTIFLLNKINKIQKLIFSPEMRMDVVKNLQQANKYELQFLNLKLCMELWSGKFSNKNIDTFLTKLKKKHQHFSATKILFSSETRSTICFVENIWS